VHDGPTTFADQLNKMSAIYASAAVTIVAAGGDGADGISGLRNISTPRCLKQKVFAIRDRHLVLQHDEREAVDFKHDSSDEAYNMRGWTYQEYVMSPRKLVFMDEKVYWVCRCGRRYESDVQGIHRANGGGYDPSEFIRTSYPDLVELAILLSWYNRRNFTHPGDALPAISGLLAVLSRGFEGGFLCGLPERFFDLALGWKPMDNVTRKSCKPRRGCMLDCESASTTTSAFELPSWSWTAWQGSFSFGYKEVARVYKLWKTRYLQKLARSLNGSPPQNLPAANGAR
jgi:hypothetical protein